jgi:hypothetical protein
MSNLGAKFGLRECVLPCVVFVCPRVWFGVSPGLVWCVPALVWCVPGLVWYASELSGLRRTAKVARFTLGNCAEGKSA